MELSNGLSKFQEVSKGFIAKVTAMDYETLKYEMEHQDLLIRFTKRAIGPNGDKTMENQLERLDLEKEFMVTWFGKMTPPKQTKKKKNVTKRRKTKRN